MAAHAAPSSLLQRWADAQPVRLFLYGLTVPVLAACVVYGWLTTEQAGAWLAVAGALFGATVAGTELARRVAWAPVSVEQVLADTDRRAYRDGVEHGLQQRPADLPATAHMQAVGRCRRVEDGNRCVLPAHPEVVAHQYE
jgi:hypothetical protein